MMIIISETYRKFSSEALKSFERCVLVSQGDALTFDQRSGLVKVFRKWSWWRGGVEKRCGGVG